MEALRTASVFVDSTPPVTALFVNGALENSASLNILPGDQLALAAVDAASGLRELGTSVDGGAFALYAGSFTLPSGLHTLRYRGQDNVLNLEQERLVSITVSSPGGDTTPPSLSLSCPGSESGVCSVFNQRFPVRGTVFDANLASYRLESGTVFISSGTGNINGTLGIWDLTALAGGADADFDGSGPGGQCRDLDPPNLRRRARPVVGLRLQEGHGAPQGVAVDLTRGVAYVANADKGEIRLYGLDGAFIKRYKDYRHPRAVAVDESGNLYIAESGKDRIVKLGPTGNLLWKKGRTGRDPLEFRDPSGVAALGAVAVSIRATGGSKFLDGDGNFVREFPIPEGTGGALGTRRWG